MGRYSTEGIPASVRDFEWLKGAWAGKFKDDAIEEQWSGEHCGTMMGMFRWMRDGQVRFYELILIEPEGDDLVLRLKHFNPGLVGWEEKDRAVEFVLTEWDGKKAVFYERNAPKTIWMVYHHPDHTTLEIWFETPDDTAEPTRFLYQRIG